MKPRIVVGKRKKTEPGVRLGLVPSRDVADLRLFIGDEAHLRSGTVIYLGSRIGHRLQTGHNAIIREENQIGDNLSLWSNSVLDYDCRVGNNVKIHTNCYIAQRTTIEDDVFIAPGVIIANDLHPGTPDAVSCMKGPTLGSGVQVGCNVTILPRVVIGERSVIGAGSVVTRDVPPHSVVYGNPARVVKKIEDYRCPVKGNFPYRDELVLG
jgi:acetyltransferase-like isoleucine patch superfamily enzyme